MNIIPFDFNDNMVRVVEQEAEFYFVAKDVCDILGYDNPTMALQKLDEDEHLTSKIFSSGQSRDMRAVTESGLYTLILRSNKPEAKPFRRWVTHEVLPSIRKKGSYTGTFAQGTLPFDDEDIEVFFDKNGLEVPHPSQHRYKLPETISHAWIRTIVDLYGKKIAGNYFASHLGIPQTALPLQTAPVMVALSMTQEMSDFLEECIIKDRKESTSVAAVYETYLQWGGVMNRNNFGKELLACTGTQSIVRNVNGVSTRFYHGITLKARCDLD